MTPELYSEDRAIDIGIQHVKGNGNKVSIEVYEYEVTGDGKGMIAFDRGDKIYRDKMYMDYNIVEKKGYTIRGIEGGIKVSNYVGDIAIYDTAGRMIYKGEVNGEKKIKTNSGVYYVRLGNNKIQKVVVLLR